MTEMDLDMNEKDPFFSNLEFNGESQLLEIPQDDSLMFELPGLVDAEDPLFVSETLPEDETLQQEAIVPQLSLKQRMLRGRFASLQQRVDASRNNELRLDNDPSTNLTRNSLGNSTIVNTPTPPDDLYTQDNFLGDFDWDYDNNSFAHADSTTLASEGRASYDFDGLRASTEYIDSIRPLDLPTKVSLTSTISNSLSNMFKINANNSSMSTSRFTLKSMNPLSHKEETTELQLENVTEDAEMTYNDQKKSVVQPAKKKRTTLTNALASARLPFGSKREQTLPEESVNFEFDEELTRVISMASMNSSSYNFNTNPRVSLDKSSVLSSDVKQEVEVDDAFANISLGKALDAKIEEKEEEEDEIEDAENNSPDYAALFSDVKTKKKTKSLSTFRKKNSIQAVPVIKVESSESTAETILPPLPEGATLPIVPPVDEPPRRGRKPTLEYDASKQFVCSYCLRRFRRQEHLKRHFRSLHTNDKPFDCNLCGKKFSRNDNLAQHIKTHNEDGETYEED